jgi:hypothetical protein
MSYIYRGHHTNHDSVIMTPNDFIIFFLLSTIRGISAINGQVFSVRVICLTITGYSEINLGF